MSIVVDASAAIDIALGLRPRLALDLVGHDLHVPMTFDVEVASALRRLELTGSLTPVEAGMARTRVASLAFARHAPEPYLIGTCWPWRHDITIQDGVYVALALLLRAALATTDNRLARTAGPLVDLVSEPA